MIQMRKKTALLLGLNLLAGGIGIWLGRESAPVKTIEISGSCIFVTCGGGNYPKEAFTTVNEELPERLDSLLGENAHSDHLVLVTPVPSGYDVNMVGLAGSKLWDKSVQHELTEWIAQRMDAVQLSTPARVESGADGKMPEAVQPLH